MPSEDNLEKDLDANHAEPTTPSTNGTTRVRNRNGKRQRKSMENERRKSARVIAKVDAQDCEENEDIATPAKKLCLNSRVQTDEEYKTCLYKTFFNVVKFFNEAGLNPLQFLARQYNEYLRYRVEDSIDSDFPTFANLIFDFLMLDHSLIISFVKSIKNPKCQTIRSRRNSNSSSSIEAPQGEIPPSVNPLTEDDCPFCFRCKRHSESKDKKKNIMTLTAFIELRRNGNVQTMEECNGDSANKVPHLSYSKDENVPCSGIVDSSSLSSDNIDYQTPTPHLLLSKKENSPIIGSVENSISGSKMRDHQEEIIHPGVSSRNDNGQRVGRKGEPRSHNKSCRREATPTPMPHSNNGNVHCPGCTGNSISVSAIKGDQPAFVPLSENQNGQGIECEGIPVSGLTHKPQQEVPHQTLPGTKNDTVLRIEGETTKEEYEAQIEQLKKKLKEQTKELSGQSGEPRGQPEVSVSHKNGKRGQIKEIEQQCEEFRSKLNEIDQFRSQIDELKVNLQESQGQNETQRERIKELESQIEKYKSQNGELGGQLGESQNVGDQPEDLQSQNDELQGRVARLEKIEAEQASEIKALRAYVECIMRSAQSRQDLG